MVNKTPNYALIMNTPGYTAWEKLKNFRALLQTKKDQRDLLEVDINELLWKMNSGMSASNPRTGFDDARSQLIHAQKRKQSDVLLKEIAFINEVIAKLVEIAELSRVEGMSDEDMYEYNYPEEARAILFNQALAELAANGQIAPTTALQLMKEPLVLTQLRSAIISVPGSTKGEVEQHPILSSVAGAVLSHDDNTIEKQLMSTLSGYGFTGELE